MVQTVKQLKPTRSVYYKSVSATWTAEDVDSNKVFGYLAAFGNKDSDRDIIHKGAFLKSINERGPKSTTARKMAFLYAHKMDTPIGRFTHLEEKGNGLYYEAELDDIPFVRETIKPQMKSKTLNNHSIGYNYVWDKIEYNEKSDEFNVYELDTYEGSVLALGSNENTPVGGFKNYFESTDDYREMAHRADRLLKRMGSYESEMELRTILQKYQSLCDAAAEEITAMRKQPKSFDYKALARDFKL